MAMEKRSTDLLRRVVHMYYEAGKPASHTRVVDEWLGAWASNWSLHADPEFAVRESSRSALLLVENPICDLDNFNDDLATFLRDSIEYLARIGLRGLLHEHYINGLEHGELVERWLRDHKGWFPDEQLIWDYPKPKDDGIECRSSNPSLAVREAFRVIHLVLAGCPDNRDWDDMQLEQLLAHMSRYFMHLKALKEDVACLPAVCGQLE